MSARQSKSEMGKPKPTPPRSNLAKTKPKKIQKKFKLMEMDSGTDSDFSSTYSGTRFSSPPPPSALPMPPSNWLCGHLHHQRWWWSSSQGHTRIDVFSMKLLQRKSADFCILSASCPDCQSRQSRILYLSFKGSMYNLVDQQISPWIPYSFLLSNILIRNSN